MGVFKDGMVVAGEMILSGNPLTLASQRNFNMSIITITARQPISSPVIFKLHKLLSSPVSEIKKRITFELPIFHDEIFDNNYEEKSETLREIIKFSENESIELDIIESPTKDCDPKYKMAITKEILKNILKSADSESERF